MLWFLVPIVLVVVYATLVERFWFAIRRADLAILPKGAKEITILHISDIHMAPWQRRKQQWIKKLAALKPDFVINTGDNLGHSKAIPSVLTSLSDLNQISGVFVNGSNDMFAPSVRNPFTYFSSPSKAHPPSHQKLETSLLNSAFTDKGWINLNNATAKLLINGVRLSFIGTDDAHENLADLSNLKPLATSDLVIGVTHAPYLTVLSELNQKGAELIFAGHTHGGQVCWPFTGRALVTNCDLPTRYARGLAQLELQPGKKFWLNVCAGLGNSIFAPIRFACRPEIRLVTLRAKN